MLLNIDFSCAVAESDSFADFFLFRAALSFAIRVLCEYFCGKVRDWRRGHHCKCSYWLLIFLQYCHFLIATGFFFCCVLHLLLSFGLVDTASTFVTRYEVGRKATTTGAVIDHCFFLHQSDLWTLSRSFLLCVLVMDAAVFSSMRAGERETGSWMALLGEVDIINKSRRVADPVKRVSHPSLLSLFHAESYNLRKEIKELCDKISLAADIGTETVHLSFGPSQGIRDVPVITASSDRNMLFSEVERLRSIVLCGLAESSSTSASKRFCDGFQSDCHIIDFLDIECNPITGYRMGRLSKDQCRLVKVVFPSLFYSDDMPISKNSGYIRTALNSKIDTFGLRKHGSNPIMK
uniref:DUF4220 domain-containing protein n=1 Tax=Haemonchus placei TaxID=6290 RepID=A0A0N4WAJ8_HAEPC